MEAWIRKTPYGVTKFAIYIAMGLFWQIGIYATELVQIKYYMKRRTAHSPVTVIRARFEAFLFVRPGGRNIIHHPVFISLKIPDSNREESRECTSGKSFLLFEEFPSSHSFNFVLFFTYHLNVCPRSISVTLLQMSVLR